MEIEYTKDEIDTNKIGKRARAAHVQIIEDLLNSDAKNCILSARNQREFQATYTSLYNYIHRTGVSVTIYRNYPRIYLIKG